MKKLFTITALAAATALSFGALNLAYAAETENASSDKKTERYGQLLSYV